MSIKNAKIQSGDILVTDKGDHQLCVNKGGELVVFSAETWYPLENMLDNPQSYGVVKVVRPETNSDLTAGIFNKSVGRMDVVWEKNGFAQIPLNTGLKFDAENDEGEVITLVLYQIGVGLFKLFEEGDFNRMSDTEFTNTDKAYKVIDHIENDLYRMKKVLKVY